MARTTTKTNDLTSPLYASLGATDRAVELVRESVADVRTRLNEARRNDLKANAVAVPQRVQGFLEEHEVSYGQLVARGDELVRRIRGQKATQDAVKSARTTSAKAKTTGTQASKAGRSTATSAKDAAKDTASTARRQSKSPKSSAKATGTAASKTAKSAAKATVDAGKKVGS